ncbi:MAG TPA: DUF190 domain-containing protein [Solirubrobacteraceae bacterium]|nr:DUF190 domain-containing protein [Solirubrobacteraceae bacterium]
MEDCLKLTTYFGERDRTDADRRVADRLVELFSSAELATSVLLRGVGGYGLGHGMRSDQLLTLSEDLPVVAVAVDARARIEALLPELLAMANRGLITLERARLVGGARGGAPPAPDALPASLGESVKLTVYLGRQERTRTGRPAHLAVTELLHACGVSGATVLLGVDGTRRGVRHRARFFGANAQVPLMVLSVAPLAQIAHVLPELDTLLEDPLLTLERVQICKRDGLRLSAPAPLAGEDAEGLALFQKLTVHSSESARHGGQPLHRAIVTALRAERIAGATSLRGIWGFHGDHPPHGDRLLQVHRHTPVMTIVVDTPERVARAFAIVDALTAQNGLVTAETVPAARAASAEHTRGGVRLGRPPR